MRVGSLTLACTEPDTGDQLLTLARAIVDGATDAAEAHPLRLVESPAAALARAAHATAGSDVPLDASACLQAWCASARRLLREAHQNPGQMVLLDADEVQLAPAAARAAWRRRAGLEPSAPDGPAATTGPRLDALGLAAAAIVVARHPDAARLWSELQGSCLLLDEAGAHDEPAPDLALKTWREWQLNLADLQQTLGDCQARLADGQGRLDAQTAELAQARDDASLAEMMRRQSLAELESVAAMAAPLEALSRERQSRLEVLETRLDQSERALELERQARAQEQQQVQQLQAALADRESRLVHLDGELVQRTGALQAALDASSAAIARERGAQATHLQQIEAELDTLRRDRARFIVLVERSRQEIDQLNRQRDAERAAMDAERLERLAEQAAAAAERAAMDAERAAVEVERGQSQAAQAALGEHIAALQRQLAAERQERETLEAQATRQAEDGRREAADLRDALAQATHQARLDEEALHALQQTGQHLAQRERELQQTVSDLRERGAQDAIELRELLNEADASRARAEALASELAQAREQRQTTDALESVWQQRWHQARTRIELLESQLGDALSGLVQAAAPAGAPKAAPSSSWSMALAATRVGLIAERDAAPHRELGLVVELPAGVQAPARRFELRLVEHGGRPGLVWMPAAAGVPPLHAWQPNGHEGDRPFMRLIPQDVDGAALLARLPSADWRLVTGLAEQLPHWVSSLGLASPELWRTAARRLLAQLQAMPPRLRFSELQATWSEPAAAGGAPGLAHIRLSDALFGDNSLPDIELAFDSTGDRDATLSWLLPGSGLPGFASWPVQADGRLQPHCPLAVGRALSVPSKWRWWAERPARDRDLLLGLLDALPAAADALGSTAQAPVLRQQLAGLHREARRLVERQALGGRLRRLKNLLRPATKA